MDIIRAVAKRVLIGLLILLAAMYASDYVWVGVRMARPKSGGAIGSVKMDRLYAIRLKGNRIEYQFDARHPEETKARLHSLFPHSDYSPCWYLQRRSHQPIPMSIVFPPKMPKR